MLIFKLTTSKIQPIPFISKHTQNTINRNHHKVIRVKCIHILINLMDRVIRKLQECHNWRDQLRRNCIKNQVNTAIATYYTPQRFNATYPHFVEAQAKKNRANGWIQNQLKAYHWISIALSYAQDVTIQEFSIGHWQILSEIFYFKNPSLLKYESRLLILKKGQQLAWEVQQQKIYVQIMQNHFGLQRSTNSPTSKWSIPALQLFEKSDQKYVRSGKQCREKWVNHLDPTRNRGEWIEAQQRELAGLILQEGRKWSSLARKMSTNRTENMIKKRYTTIIRNLKKVYPKIKDEDDLLRCYLNIQQSKTTIVLKNQNQYSIQAQKQLEGEGNHSAVQIYQKGRENQKAIYEQIKECLVIEEQGEKDLFKVISEVPGFQMTPLCSPLPSNNPRTPTLSPVNHNPLTFNCFSTFENQILDKYLYLRKSSQ